MVIVDTCVWVDLFAGTNTPQVQKLHDLILDRNSVVVAADLVMAEVLQGVRTDKQFQHAQETLSVLPALSVSNPQVAVQAAKNYRHLRTKGITPRGTIDVLIATRCTMDNIPLLTSDRDFDAFGEHLGLVLV